MIFIMFPLFCGFKLAGENGIGEPFHDVGGSKS